MEYRPLRASQVGREHLRLLDIDLKLAKEAIPEAGGFGRVAGRVEVE